MDQLHPVFYQGDPTKLIGWEDRKRNRSYRRLFGGLAWPKLNSSGFAVIVGESLQDRGPHNMGDSENTVLYVLREMETGDFEQLMRSCIQHAGKVTWHGNMNHVLNLRLLYEFNRAENIAGRLQLRLMPAPYIPPEGDLEEAFYYGVNVIRSKAKKGGLIVDETPLLRSCLEDVPKDEAVVDHAEEYPALLALCFAVSALSYYPWANPADKGTSGRALTEYDPLGEGN